jgi:hypothetical protein
MDKPLMNRPIYYQFIVFRGFMEALAGLTTQKSRSSTGILRGGNWVTSVGSLQPLVKVKKHIHSYLLTYQARRVLCSISSYINHIKTFRQQHTKHENASNLWS